MNGRLSPPSAYTSDTMKRTTGLRLLLISCLAWGSPLLAEGEPTTSAEVQTTVPSIDSPPTTSQPDSPPGTSAPTTQKALAPPAADPLSKNGEAAPPEQLLEAALQAMDHAALQLESDGSTGQAAQEQLRAIELLQKLLASANQSSMDSPDPAPTDKPSSPDTSANQQSPDKDSADSSGNSGRRSDSENSKGSNEEVAGPTQPGESPLKSTAKVNSVWGHLPRREQESLLRSLSDHFLPEYEAQIKRYYEALAEGQPRQGTR